jgi:hypothetical protein
LFLNESFKGILGVPYVYEAVFEAEIKLASFLVLENCSKIILINTVMGMAIINPGIPHKNPQNINITKTVIILIENDFPIKTGSIMAPKTI